LLKVFCHKKRALLVAWGSYQSGNSEMAVSLAPPVCATPCEPPTSVKKRLVNKRLDECKLGASGNSEMIVSLAPPVGATPFEPPTSSSVKKRMVNKHLNECKLVATDTSEMIVNLAPRPPPLVATPCKPPTSSSVKKRMVNKRLNECKLPAIDPNVPAADECVRGIPLPKWVVATTPTGLLRAPPGLESLGFWVEKLAEDVLSDDESLTTVPESPRSSEAADDQWI